MQHARFYKASFLCLASLLPVQSIWGLEKSKVRIPLYKAYRVASVMERYRTNPLGGQETEESFDQLIQLSTLHEILENNALKPDQLVVYRGGSVALTGNDKVQKNAVKTLIKEVYLYGNTTESRALMHQGRRDDLVLNYKAKVTSSIQKIREDQTLSNNSDELKTALEGIVSTVENNHGIDIFCKTSFFIENGTYMEQFLKSSWQDDQWKAKGDFGITEDNTYNALKAHLTALKAVWEANEAGDDAAKKKARDLLNNFMKHFKLWYQTVTMEPLPQNAYTDLLAEIARQETQQVLEVKDSGDAQSVLDQAKAEMRKEEKEALDDEALAKRLRDEGFTLKQLFKLLYQGAIYDPETRKVQYAIDRTQGRLFGLQVDEIDRLIQLKLKDQNQRHLVSLDHLEVEFWKNLVLPEALMRLLGMNTEFRRTKMTRLYSRSAEMIRYCKDYAAKQQKYDILYRQKEAHLLNGKNDSKVGVALYLSKDPELEKQNQDKYMPPYDFDSLNKRDPLMLVTVLRNIGWILLFVWIGRKAIHLFLAKKAKKYDEDEEDEDDDEDDDDEDDDA